MGLESVENWNLMKEKLMEEGLTSAQATSKSAKITFAICAQNPDLLKLIELEDQIDSMNKYISRLYHEELHYEREIRDLRQKWETMKCEDHATECRAQDILDETKAYIDSFNESLKRCESEKGRDLMRRAQLFADSIDIETPQNKTAYINGLACILSGGECGSMFDGFKRIRSKRSNSIPTSDNLKEQLREEAFEREFKDVPII